MTTDANTAVFLGPSLPVAEAQSILPEAQFYAPAQAGDIYRAYTFANAQTIVLIDGVFGPVPSVWHKEILGALEAGCVVVGASSMGALRAAECNTFGMIGHGWVYEQYSNGMLEGDDEVALLHLGKEDEYLPMSVPMVRLRHGVMHAIAQGDANEAECAVLLETAHQIFYAERTWERLFDTFDGTSPELQNLVVLLRSSSADIKADDARSALRMVAQNEFRAPLNPTRVEGTAFWQRLREEARIVAPFAAAGRPPAPIGELPDYVHTALLAPADHCTGLEARISAHLVVTMSEQLGIIPSVEEVSHHSDALRRRFGLSTRASMTAWMQEHTITLRDWSAAVRHDLLIDRLEDEFARELSRYIPLVHARACMAPPQARSAPTTEESANSLDDLLQLLAVESGIPTISTYDELARRLGFPSVSALAEAARKTSQATEL